jgi:hypothetical protein
MKKALVALLFFLVHGSAGYPSAELPVFATPIPIDPNDPGHVRFGRLRFLAGWHLTSRESNFGGYSSLHVEGDHFFTLADTGEYLRFRMARPGVISEARFATLPAFPGHSGTRADRDSESMTIGPEGDIWVGFEGYNAILRYPRELNRLTAIAYPPAMRDWETNTGAEAMTRLEGGRFVVFCEGKLIGRDIHAALMFPGDPTDPKNVPFQFGYKPPHGYVPTDATQLPDGRIIVLNRHFGLLDGFSAAVTIVDPARIAPDATVPGELVAEFRPPLNIDNMEGISVVRAGGHLIVWMISDDNQIPLQRTLLLKFELEEGAKK